MATRHATGCHRCHAQPGADGPANLLAALQVASSQRFGGLGCLVVANDQVHAARYVRKTHSSNPATFASPNSDDAGLLTGLADRYAGLVVAGFGVGQVPAALADPLGALAARIPVVLASRTGTGPVFAHTYGFAGSESDLRSRGLIGAGFLDPYKSRVLLRLLLANGADRATVEATFATAGGLAGS